MIAVPAMGDSITEGTVVKWHFAVGDQVEMDQIMCEVETDKVCQCLRAPPHLVTSSNSPPFHPFPLCPPLLVLGRDAVF